MATEEEEDKEVKEGEENIPITSPKLVKPASEMPNSRGFNTNLVQLQKGRRAVDAWNALPQAVLEDNHATLSWVNQIKYWQTTGTLEDSQTDLKNMVTEDPPQALGLQE